MAQGPEVPPPWKQECYIASSESEMRETKVTSATQIRTEERWEGRYGVQEQMTISGAAGAAVTAGAKEVRSEPSHFLPRFLILLSPTRVLSGNSVCVGCAYDHKNIQKLMTKFGSCFVKAF